MNFYTFMDSKFLTEKFLPVVEDPSKFEFVLVSDNVKLRDPETLKNVQTLTSLLPPSYVLNALDSSKKQYRDMYSTYLSDPENEYKLAILTKSLAENPELSVILVCSPDEHNDYKYLKLLVEEMELKFGLLHTPSKDVVKLLEKGKANKLKFEDEDVDVVLDTVTTRIETLQRLGVGREASALEQELIELNNELQTFTKKELRKIAKRIGAKFDKDMKPSKLREKILKKHAKTVIKKKEEEMAVAEESVKKDKKKKKNKKDSE